MTRAQSACAGRIVAAVLLVFAVAAGGCRRPATSGPEVTPDPSNELPFGVVDQPRNGDTVGRVVDVIGWALDDSLVRDVRVSVDGTYQASARLTIRRPDVANAYPKYPASRSNTGWQATVDLGETAGRHTITAGAVDDRGATRDIGQVVVLLIDR